MTPISLLFTVLLTGPAHWVCGPSGAGAQPVCYPVTGFPIEAIQKGGAQ